MAETIFRVPTDVEQARIAAEASKGDDTELPARDQRSRARISARTHHEPGAVLTIPGEGGAEVRVVSPGRGEGWALVCWVEGGTDCVGTYHEGDVAGPKPAWGGR